MLPGYWQALSFPLRYWQDWGSYWPHHPEPDGGGVGGEGRPHRFEYPWILERIFLDDDDEVLVLL